MNGQNSWSTTIKESAQSKHRLSPTVEKKRSLRKPLPRPHETEEEATLRRFHDAQRMARFRARRKKALEEAKALEAAKMTEIALISELKKRNVVFQIKTIQSIDCQHESSQFDKNHKAHEENPVMMAPTVAGQSKYSQLLAVIEELGRDIRLSYAGSRTSVERLKIGIVHARMLVRDCLLETEVNLRQ